jgi:hypothetical protein
MQGLCYNPEDKKYKGDMAMRMNNKRKKALCDDDGRFVAAVQVNLAAGKPHTAQLSQEANHKMAIWGLE